MGHKLSRLIDHIRACHKLNPEQLSIVQELYDSLGLSSMDALLLNPAQL